MTSPELTMPALVEKMNQLSGVPAWIGFQRGPGVYGEPWSMLRLAIPCGTDEPGNVRREFYHHARSASDTFLAEHGLGDNLYYELGHDDHGNREFYLKIRGNAPGQIESLAPVVQKLEQLQPSFQQTMGSVLAQARPGEVLTTPQKAVKEQIKTVLDLAVRLEAVKEAIAQGTRPDLIAQAIQESLITDSTGRDLPEHQIRELLAAHHTILERTLSRTIENTSKNARMELTPALLSCARDYQSVATLHNHLCSHLIRDEQDDPIFLTHPYLRHHGLKTLDEVTEHALQSTRTRREAIRAALKYPLPEPTPQLLGRARDFDTMDELIGVLSQEETLPTQSVRGKAAGEHLDAIAGIIPALAEPIAKRRQLAGGAVAAEANGHAAAIGQRSPLGRRQLPERRDPLRPDGSAHGKS